jgi:4'-phosphopantetheinyl transferase
MLRAGASDGLFGLAMNTPEPPPKEDEVHVWYACPELDLPPHLRNRHEELLSDDERERYRRFVFDADRLRYLVAHALVRTTLSRYADVPPQTWTFSQNEYGKPEIDGPAHALPCRFSLTHTHGLTAIAITATAAIGVDAERILPRESNVDIAQRFFAPSEAVALQALSPAEQRCVFYDYWTLKEAYLKAIGVGMSVPLQSFAFTLSDPPRVRFHDPELGDPARWQFARLSLSREHTCAIAIRLDRAPRVLMNDARVRRTAVRDKKV